MAQPNAARQMAGRLRRGETIARVLLAREFVRSYPMDDTCDCSTQLAP
jgi:hypothetical protein